MRKVKDNQISLRMIEPDTVHKRLKSFEGRDIQNKTILKVGKLIPWLENLGNTKTNVNIKPLMNRIYNDIDYFMKEEIYPHTVCVKGCAHCCTVPVQVSLIEASYIAQQTSHKLQRSVKSRYKMPPLVTSYCPLLDQETGTCSAYEYRPLACRLFATFDSWSFCEKNDQKHYIHCFESQPIFKVVHNFLLIQSQHSADAESLAAVAEIRDWFV